MKSMKKLTSILLALVMAVAMAVPALAAEVDLADLEGPMTGGKITLTNATKDQTYDLYQILYLESYEILTPATGAGNYAYKATQQWKPFFNTAEAKEFITIDSTGYATWVDGDSPSRVQKFAKAALKYAKENGIKPVATKNGDATGSLVFDNLNLGYYLADSTVGTLCTLNTTNKEFTAEDKNKTPTNTKYAEENGDFRQENDVSVGTEFRFKSTVVAQEGALNYVFHDKMQADVMEYTRIDKIVYKVSNNPEVTLAAYNPETPDAEWDYKTVLPEEDAAAFHDCGCTFHVVFNQTFLDKMQAGINIDIYYYAKLTQAAVVAGAGNTNTSWLTYGENGALSTAVSETVTKTWNFDIFKFVSDANAADGKKPLDGATFKLVAAKNGLEDPGAEAAPLTFSAVAGQENTYKYDPTGTVTSFTSPADGRIHIQGLDAATYYLYETAAPSGYNLMGSSVKVVIEQGTGKVFKNLTATTDKTIDIENRTGNLLPSTGGIGTTIFYVVGGILLVVAGVLLVVRKRMSSSKEAR